jgi:hypothetical protein
MSGGAQCGDESLPMMPDFVFAPFFCRSDDWKSHFAMRNLRMLHCRIFSQYKKIISA